MSPQHKTVNTGEHWNLRCRHKLMIVATVLQVQLVQHYLINPLFSGVRSIVGVLLQ